jgi:hypothetical protein
MCDMHGGRIRDIDWVSSESLHDRNVAVTVVCCGVVGAWRSFLHLATATSSADQMF